VTNYNLERQQLGRNTWTKIGDIPGQPTYRDRNIDCGRKYCYRIRAKNSEGFSDVITTSDIAAGNLGEKIPYFCPYFNVVNYQLFVFRKSKWVLNIIKGVLSVPSIPWFSCSS